MSTEPLTSDVSFGSKSTTIGKGRPSSTESTTKGSQGTSTTAPETTTGKFCDEMEYINTLIATNSVQTKPTNIYNTKDLITEGVDFTDAQPSLVIDIPKGG